MDIALNALIAGLGLGVHIVMKWAKTRTDLINAGLAPVGLVAFVQTVPAQTSLSVLATAAAFVVTAALGWLNPGMALACGYMGDSMVKNIAGKFASTDGRR